MDTATAATVSSNRSQNQGSLLDLLDREDPTATNLDLIIEEKLIEECETTTIRTIQKSNANAEEPIKSHENTAATETDLDQEEEEEDVITVKYLPIEMASSSSSSSGNRMHTHGSIITNEMEMRKQQQQHQCSGGSGYYTNQNEAALSSQVTSKNREPSSANQVVERDNCESPVRIVEHIRKNLTLFESNREVYELCPAYENRGYLQSLLVAQQRQPPQTQSQPQPPITTTTTTAATTTTTTRAVSFSRKPVSDQYTQYRESDLNRLPITKLRTSKQPLPIQQQQSIRLPNKPEVIHQGNKGSAIQVLLRKPIEFVKLAHSKRGQKQQDPSTQVKSGGEDLYKVPVVKQQQFSGSQSLYLVPVPDSEVHIATKSIKEIVAAYQRAKSRSNQHRTQDNTTANNRFSQLFASYSFKSLSGGKRSNSDQTKKSRRSLSLPRRERVQILKSRAAAAIEPQPTLDNSIERIKAKIKMPSGKSDKATIVDNKDGTIKISYEPKEVGQHEIALRYNDEPIDESPMVFYVDAVGAGKKKITAYGSGLTHGSVGDNCRFSINTGGLGSAKLNVSIEGPSKCPVNLADNKDGTISVTYQPNLPGEYKIKLSFDGKQVVGSPFTTSIGDEDRQRSQISVGRGSEHTLEGLKVSEEDLKSLDAVINTPCGLEEPCGFKTLKNGQLAIVFTPREQGEHIVHVRRRGNHISGSPFKFDVLSRDIGDAKQVKISGKGLKEGKTNADNEIIINTKDAGYGGLSVTFEGPSRSELSTKEVNQDGQVKLIYKTTEPGNYSLIVKYADHIVPGSPYQIKITGQGTNPQKETLRKFRKVAPISEVNTECHFNFKLPGVSAYDLSAKIHSPQGNAEDVSIKDQGDYVYQVSFVPKETGLYSLSIRNKDIHICGSPFPYTVGPIIEFGPHKVRCGGPGLLRGCCGKLNEFDIFTREAGAGELVVVVDGPSKAELTYKDRKDGSCCIGYKVASPGEYRISVHYNDQEVPDSPFKAYIMPLTGEVSKIELGPMPPENMIQLNKPCNLTVIMNGAKGNIEGKVKLPGGKSEDCFASPIDAENWGVRFIPRELGIHQVHIKFNKGASHIPQSPIFIRVGHDNADPASVMAHGQGLKGSIVNHASDFIVETCSAGHALLECHIEGPSKVPMGCAELDEGYKINYTPLAPGDYLIVVKYNGCHIGGSPFKVRAIKQPGSRTVADAGSHEVSKLTISTTDREAKQKVEHMPKFKSDASNVYCKGMGLKKAFTGKPNVLTVNCSEAGFNMIYVSFLGPNRNTIHECSVKHMGGSIFEVKYTCKDKGDAILVVKYGDEQIPGSPFRLECV